jgi:hypothetical protein
LLRVILKHDAEVKIPVAVQIPKQKLTLRQDAQLLLKTSSVKPVKCSSEGNLFWNQSWREEPNRCFLLNAFFEIMEQKCFRVPEL